MPDFEDLVGLVPLPVVDLRDIGPPHDGLVVLAPTVCATNFSRGPACNKHYQHLATLNSSSAVQCPFGFCSSVIHVDGFSIALTGVIPFPRLGGDGERRMAKLFPKNKIPQGGFGNATGAVIRGLKRVAKVEHGVVKKHSMALHEIRKLNRTVKHTAERMCNDESPGDPDAANPNLVQIWKTAELMSQQFDVIEILANESLTALPLNSISEIYRIFDKCVRIYRASGVSARIALRAAPGYSPRIRACDKTLSIIPSVLIENALKYSLPGSPIAIDISPLSHRCMVRVTNQAKGSTPLTDDVFKKGVRASTDKDGSGHGLYLAKLVAIQHKGDITLESRAITNDSIDCSFIVLLPETI